MKTAIAVVPSLSRPLDRISMGRIVEIRERLLAAQAAGTTVYRFESGDPGFAPPAGVLEAITAAGRAGQTHYVPNNGIPVLRRALAQKCTAVNRMPGLSEQDVFLTNGAMHALYVTFGALLSPGDEVIIPDPMWTEVGENIRLAGGTPVGVPLRREDDFAYRPDAIEAAITPRTVAIFLNTPHNPTGAVLERDTLAAIAALASERGLWLVADEAYEDIIYAPSVHHSIASLPEADPSRTVTVYSFSKSHAMPGLRVGYIVTRSEQLHELIPKLLRCTINGVNSLAQAGALAAVTGDQGHLATMCAEYRLRRDLLLAALGGLEGVHAFVPRGAFYLWVSLDPAIYRRFGVADADALSDALAARGLGNAPGSAFGRSCRDALRFSFSSSTAMVREGSAVLRAALA
ncbi:MAG: pyridoxal phosphate-dependent aminotransferase [Terriglobales bacterium]